jgi:4-alpha-glucanotransferase
MFASHADTLIIPVQDMLLFGSDTRINKPGIAEGNWSYRVTKEQFWRIDREKFKYLNHLCSRSR